ncbi:MAG: hypothetical protein QXW79_00915 [Thermoplasmata archaeon]
MMDKEIDDGYDSCSEIKIDLIEHKYGKSCTQVISIPFRPVHCNEKRLICLSIINNKICNYGEQCTYAHSLEEQIIDSERSFIYKIILDRDLMKINNFSDLEMEETYKYLLVATRLCEKCRNNRCTGGYNCRYGVNTPYLKICRNDLLTGECINKVIDINIPEDIIRKICSPHNDVTYLPSYKGCINGHHLSERKLVPYYKYVHQKKNLGKYIYQFSRPTVHPIEVLDKVEEFSDEEIDSWFRKDDSSDSE